MAGHQKTVLITGASGGIGLELARLFAADGHDLVLVARSAEGLERARRELESKFKISVTAISKDLSDTQACRRLYDKVTGLGLRVETLVNNAGSGAYGDFWTTDLDAEIRMMNLNMVSLVHLTKLFLKDMIPTRRGRILNVASTAAFQPGPLMAVYYATKAFVLSFSEALANETRGAGITVTALCPGPTDTNFRAAAGMKKSMLFSRHLNLPPGEVARAGYEGMKRGKTIVIPGFKNRLIVQLLRVVPRELVTRMVRKAQEARRV